LTHRDRRSNHGVVVSGEPANEHLAEQLVGLLLDGKKPLLPDAD
jgi:hypothetical protein